MVGNSLLALFKDEKEESKLVIVFALMAMCCLGVRVVISKFCTQVISTVHYIELNFFVEFGLAIVLITLYFTGYMEMQFESSRIMMLAGASLLCIFAEFFLFLGIDLGVIGVVVAVVASNFVLIAIIS